MARALIVGCGCRGRRLGRAMLEGGWQVRGTSRSELGLAAITEAGLDAARADPDRVGTVVELLDGVTVIFWLFGAARGDPGLVSALHGPRLERLLEEIVDTPVRGFVYEGGGDAPAADREYGAAAVRAASARWRIPVAVVAGDPAEYEGWRAEMLAAAEALLSPP